jgi:hypothetical protein
MVLPPRVSPLKTVETVKRLACRLEEPRGPCLDHTKRGGASLHVCPPQASDVCRLQMPMVEKILECYELSRLSPSLTQERRADCKGP